MGAQDHPCEPVPPARVIWWSWAQPPARSGRRPGRTLDELVVQLVALHVSRLMDLRLNPISRKPGRKQNRPRSGVDRSGIACEHHRDLGNPETNGSGFAGDITEWNKPELDTKKLLRRPDAIEALDALARAASEERVARAVLRSRRTPLSPRSGAGRDRRRITSAAATRHPAQLNTCARSN
jgi:hypothetical protein